MELAIAPYPVATWHIRLGISGAPMRLHTTIFKGYVKDKTLIKQEFKKLENYAGFYYLYLLYYLYMKAVLIALGLMFLLFIANSFFGGNPLG